MSDIHSITINGELYRIPGSESMPLVLVYNSDTKKWVTPFDWSSIVAALTNNRLVVMRTTEDGVSVLDYVLECYDIAKKTLLFSRRLSSSNGQRVITVHANGKLTATNQYDVSTVNGKSPDANGNVQVEAGGGSEIFRVELFDGCPEDDEEGWIERTLAAIKAGKIIEVYDAGEGGYLKVSYGWRMVGEWDEETEEEIPVYHVGEWSFREGGSGGGEDEGEDEGGEDYGDISDYDITIAEFEGYSNDEEDSPPRIVIRGISRKDLLNFYKEGVTSFVATYDDDTGLGTPGEQVECTFEFEEEEEDSWWLTSVRTDNGSYSDEVYFE